MTFQRFLGPFALLALLGVAACSSHGGSSMLPTAATGTMQYQDPAQALETPADGYYPLLSADSAVPACRPSVARGHARCFAWRRTDLVPDESAGPNAVPKGAGYSAADIASAYNLNVTKGAGQTIATVDAFGYTQAESDLAYYRKANGLPPCTTANGCLHIVNQYGATSPLPAPNTDPSQDWRSEQALDLDALSAACPKCHIVLVQTQDSDLNSLGAGVVTAAQTMHANVISNSYGIGEDGGLTQSYNQPGHVIVASAGDNGGGLALGGGPLSPCTFATVVCAGGTHLARGGAPRGWHESVWNELLVNLCGGPCGATGSGCSNIVPKPVWQLDTGCHMRSAVDVSADAATGTPFAVYSVLFKTSAPYTAWAPWGGTSLSSPLIAGMFGLAGNAASRHGAEEIWHNHKHLNDVIKGTNVVDSVSGPCASAAAYICVAGTGFDGPTGWGTPNGTSDL
jgi:Subtilase family